MSSSTYYTSPKLQEELSEFWSKPICGNRQYMRERWDGRRLTRMMLRNSDKRPLMEKLKGNPTIKVLEMYWVLGKIVATTSLAEYLVIWLKDNAAVETWLLIFWDGSGSFLLKRITENRVYTVVLLFATRGGGKVLFKPKKLKDRPKWEF